MKFLNDMDGASRILEDSSHRFVTDVEKAAWNAKQAAITGGASTIATSNLSTSKALISDSSGKVAASAVTSTELGYLGGVTSNVQTQLNGKAPTSHSHSISNLTDFPTSMPANGGNSDTVDGKHASDFALATQVLTNVPAGAKFTDTVYTHPSNHPPSIITQDTNNRFVTDSEKASWNNKGEANLTWGGRNFSGSYGVLDAAMVGDLGANRLAFLKAQGITVEYSRDSGSTWLDYGATDDQKVALFSGLNANLMIGKADAINKATETYELRITINTSVAQLYTALNKFCIYLSSNGSGGITCTIDTALESTPTTFITQADSIPVSGWSGYNVINTSSFTTYGNTPASQYGRVRFTFRATSGSTTHNGMQLINISGFGGVGWTVASNMARNGNLYSWDVNQNALFPALVRGTILQSTVSSGTAPLSVNSTTVVPNLNASLISGFTVAKSVPSNAVFTDTVYTHPSSHPASIITQDASNRFVTDAEKTTWNAKQNAITGGATTIATSNLTASRALVSDASGKVAVSAVTSTELGYLGGVTSAIQTQLNGKAASSHTHSYLPLTGGSITGDISLNNGVAIKGTSSFGAPNYNIAKTGSNANVEIGDTSLTLDLNSSSGNVNVNYIVGSTRTATKVLTEKDVNGGVTSILSNNLTASRALVSDASGKVAASAVTSTELGYLSGVTSAIQTQLNNKANSATTLAGYGITDAATYNELYTYQQHVGETFVEKSALIDLIYPIGSIYMSVNNVSPATFLGGTWSAIGAGTFLVAQGTGYVAGSTGGSATHAHTTPNHTHTVADHSHSIPSHTHTVNAHSHSLSQNGYAQVNTTGVGGSFVYLRGRSRPAWAPTDRVTASGYVANTTSQSWGADLAGTTDNSTAVASGAWSGTSGGSGVITASSNNGGNTGSASSLPPYLAVHMWRRTA